jgi:hypothetical protein
MEGGTFRMSPAIKVGEPEPGDVMKKILLSVLAIAATMLVAIPAHALDDDDGDLVLNYADNCPFVKNGVCSVDELNCDVDGDSVTTPEELEAGDQADWNLNGIGDACEEFDGDGIMDYLDNCPGVFNPTQDPDACADFDGDTIYDNVDNCLEDYNPGQDDRDEDGVGDACDNCLYVPNTDQADLDDDGFGDECQLDLDGDGVRDDADNCPDIFNPAQENTFGGPRGDACEPATGALPSISGENDEGPVYGSMGKHGCTIAAQAVVPTAQAGMAIALMIVAAGAIVGRFRKVRS